MARTIFITGASTGIGAATARLAAEAGWTVGLFARSADRLEALAARIGPRAMALPGDVARLEDQERAIAAMVAAHGGLDAAFANAGVGSSGGGTEGGDLDEWRTMIDVNVWGAMLTAKAAMPALKKRKGRLLLTGSNAGERFIAGSVYGATKWFIRGYGGNLAEEMSAWGGTCSIIAPGMVDTPFFDEPKPEALSAEDVARAALWALEQPRHVDVRKIHVMPNPKGRD